MISCCKPLRGPTLSRTSFVGFFDTALDGPSNVVRDAERGSFTLHLWAGTVTSENL